MTGLWEKVKEGQQYMVVSSTTVHKRREVIQRHDWLLYEEKSVTVVAPVDGVIFERTRSFL